MQTILHAEWRQVEFELNKLSSYDRAHVPKCGRQQGKACGLCGQVLKYRMDTSNDRCRLIMRIPQQSVMVGCPTASTGTIQVFRLCNGRFHICGHGVCDDSWQYMSQQGESTCPVSAISFGFRLQNHSEWQTEALVMQDKNPISSSKQRETKVIEHMLRVTDQSNYTVQLTCLKYFVQCNARLCIDFSKTLQLPPENMTKAAELHAELGPRLIELAKTLVFSAMIYHQHILRVCSKLGTISDSVKSTLRNERSRVVGAVAAHFADSLCVLSRNCLKIGTLKVDEVQIVLAYLDKVLELVMKKWCTMYRDTHQVCEMEVDTILIALLYVCRQDTFCNTEIGLVKLCRLPLLASRLVNKQSLASVGIRVKTLNDYCDRLISIIEAFTWEEIQLLQQCFTT